MTEPVRIVDYDREWPRLFEDRARAIRTEMGDVALRVDHIGSTAVVGLAAKPIIDIQISVPDLEPLDPFRGPLEQLGYVFRADNTERTKRYFPRVARRPSDTCPRPARRQLQRAAAADASGFPPNALGLGTALCGAQARARAPVPE